MNYLFDPYLIHGLSASIAPSGEYIGAVGNLIAAVLQTAGLYAQTDVLLFYQDALRSIAALLFFFSIVGALTTAAVFGNYKGGLYFLIGPLLFYGMLTGVTTAKPTSLQVGQRINQEAGEMQQKILSVYLDKDSDVYTREIKLSWFFVMFDNLVTNVSQNVISTLIDEDNKKDIVNVARERAFVEVFGARNTDQNLMELTSVGLIGKCSDVIGKYIKAGQPRFRETAAESAVSTERDKLVKEAEEQMLVENLQMPKALMNRLAKQIDPDKLRAIGLDDDVVSNWSKVATKEVHSCYDVWTFAQVISQLQAQDRIDEITNRKEQVNSEDISWGKVIDELKQTIGKDLPDNKREKALREVLAANLFKTALTGTNHAKLINQINSHVGFNADGRLFDDIFAGYYGNEAQSAIARLAMFSGIIPYLQGLFLFCLSAAFPFFCIFLVMPGRATSFLTWCWLWVWVKSWDIGFAMIQVVRDILWQWLGQTAAPYLARDLPNYKGPGDLAALTDLKSLVIRTEYVSVNWNDPSAVLHAALSADPMANVSTYHILITMLTMMVPLLTAHLCRGAGQVLSAFQGSFETISDNFGNTYGNRIEQYSANSINDALNQAASAQALMDTKKFLNQKELTGEAAGLLDQIGSALKSGNLKDFAFRGDGAMAQATQAYYAQKKQEASYSNQMMDLQQTRSIFTGRQTIWDSGANKNLGRFDELIYTDQLMGRSALETGNTPAASGNQGYNTGGSTKGNTDGQGGVLDLEQKNRPSGDIGD